MNRLPFNRPVKKLKAKLIDSNEMKPNGPPGARQLITELMVIFGVIILSICTFLWWHFIQSNPKNVFEGVLRSSLQTPSITIKTNQQGNGQSLDQTVRLNVQGQHVASGNTLLSQSGNAGSVTTQTIGLPTTDYVRYTAITTDQKGPNGQPMDFKKLLNVWGKTTAAPVAPGAAAQTNGDLYNQSVLGLVPYSNLSAAQRNELLKLMQPAYIFNNENIQKSIVNGRPTYDYEVEVSPKAYVIMLKKFAEMTGLNQLEKIDPTSYDTAVPIGFNMTVDVWSRQIKAISYPKSDRQEVVTGWGIISPPVILPKNTISVDELQSRLQTPQ